MNYVERINPKYLFDGCIKHLTHQSFDETARAACHTGISKPFCYTLDGCIYTFCLQSAAAQEAQRRQKAAAAAQEAQRRQEAAAAAQETRRRQEAAVEAEESARAIRAAQRVEKAEAARRQESEDAERLRCAAAWAASRWEQ